MFSCGWFSVPRNRGCSSVVEHLLAKERVEFESLHPLVCVLLPLLVEVAAAVGGGHRHPLHHLQQGGEVSNASTTRRSNPLATPPLQQCERLVHHGDAELLGELQHPAPGPIACLEGPHDDGEDHRHIAGLQGHREQRPTHRRLHVVVPVGGGHIQGADKDPALVGIPGIGDGLALQQISRQRPGADFAVDRHVQSFAAGLNRGDR